jgi:hypothetical protein
MKRPSRRPIIRKKKDRQPIDDSDIDWNIVEEVHAQRAAEKENRKLMHQWIQGNDGFEAGPLLNKWQNLVLLHRKELLDLAVNAFSIADGAVETNNVLRYGMNMENASLDMEEVADILVKVLRVRVTDLFARKLGLSGIVLNELLSRAVAKEFPLKDNKQSEPRTRTFSVQMPQQEDSVYHKNPPRQPSNSGRQSKIGIKRPRPRMQTREQDVDENS